MNARMTLQTSQDRKLRTRTLIQCGGLLSLSGLLDVCNIQEGDDLQSDLPSHDKAATLLGILLEAKQKLENENAFENLDNHRKSGKRLLKISAARAVY